MIKPSQRGVAIAMNFAGGRVNIFSYLCKDTFSPYMIMRLFIAVKAYYIQGVAKLRETKSAVRHYPSLVKDFRCHFGLFTRLSC
jgi:hypothetical protein